MQSFDIFISYKRVSLATALNLYNKLTQRGYSVFFDLEEMRRNDFDKQIYNYIDGAKDVIVVLEKHSLDACFNGTFNNDWFCKEIIYSLEKNKNIIPMIIDNSTLPRANDLPESIRGLVKKNYIQFSYAYFDDYITKLIDKEYILSKTKNTNSNAVFQLYANSDCSVYEEGQLIGIIKAESEMPFSYFPNHIGEHLFTFKETSSGIKEERKVGINNNEEKIIRVEFPIPLPFWKKVIGYCVVIWISLFLIGGISMYVYDNSIGEDEVIDYMSEGIKYDTNNKCYVYFLPKGYVQYFTKENKINYLYTDKKENNTITFDTNYGEHAGFGMTTSLLLVKISKSLHLNKGKEIAAYVCLSVAFVVGAGVGCVAERTLFPPQYSKPVLKGLQNPILWKNAIKQRKTGTYLQDAY